MVGVGQAMKKRVLLSWSSGKDCAWALHCLRQQTDVSVLGLFTTINEAFDRVAMHAVRVELVRLQAEALGLPVQLLFIPWPCSNADYECVMADFVASARAQGVTHMVFGDLFLEDIRQYREQRLAGSGIEPLFPLWGMPIGPLSQEMIEQGLQALITCVDPRQLNRDFTGEYYDKTLLSRLPAGVDPCGENGEFHSFVFNGPMFAAPVAIERGPVVERDGFIFADVLPRAAQACQ